MATSSRTRIRAWTPPQIRDYGTVVDLTRSHQFVTGSSATHRFLDLSSGSGTKGVTGSGTNPGATPQGSTPSPNSQVLGANANGTTGHGAFDPGGTGAGSGGGSGSGGTLPFTGDNLLPEAAAGVGLMGAGALLRRGGRKRVKR